MADDMTGKQFARALKRLELSINKAARVFMVDRSTIIRWKAEHRRVPGPAEALVRHLIESKQTGSLAGRES